MPHDNVIKNNIKVLSYNIDTNILRVEEGIFRDSFSEWRANARAKDVINTVVNIIESDHPEIIHIQECRKFITKFGDHVDSVTDLAKAIEEKNYNVLTRNYNDSGSEAVFKYITAYDPTRFVLNNTTFKHLTQTPNAPTYCRSNDLNDLTEQELQIIKNNNYGALWERGIFICSFTDQQTGSVVYSINVHLDMGFDSRINASRLIIEFAEDIIAKDKDAKIIIAGDFNTFMEPGKGGPEQLTILTSKTINDIKLLTEVTDLLDPNHQKADFTYISFPCDFGKDMQRLIQDIENQLKALSPKSRREKTIETFRDECIAESHLDRVFYRGFDKAKIKIREDHLFEKPNAYDESTIKNYTVARKSPAFASDHKPLIAKFTSYTEMIDEQKQQSNNSQLDKI